MKETENPGELHLILGQKVSSYEIQACKAKDNNYLLQMA